MEPVRNKIFITQDDIREFRSHIEGMLPDLMEAAGGDPDTCPSAFRNNVEDYVADRACDIFPDAPRQERRRVVDSVVYHFCGEQEQVDEEFPVASLFRE